MESDSVEGLYAEASPTLNLNLLRQFNMLASTPRTTHYRIAVIGKYLHASTTDPGAYVDKSDAYLSVKHAIDHAAFALGGKNGLSTLPVIDWFQVNDDPENGSTLVQQLRTRRYHGVILTGGFGTRGYESMIQIAHYTRTQNIPTLGICLGFQMMVVEYCRNVLSIPDANTTK